MKMELIRGTSLGILALLSVAGCQPLGTGTSGSNAVQSGIVHAEGATPYAVGRTSPSLISGLPDEARALNRADTALETSGAGSAELARRSAAATVESTAAKNDRSLSPSTADSSERTSDEVLLRRVQLAVRSPTENGSAAGGALSIQTLNNLRIAVHEGVVTVGGRVSDPVEREWIEHRLQAVPGVRSVHSEFDVPSNNSGSAPLP